MKEDCIEVYKKYAPDELCDNLVGILDKYSKDGMSSGLMCSHKSADRQDFQFPLDLITWRIEEEQIPKISAVLDKSLNEYISKYASLIGDIKFESYRIKLQKTLVGGGFHNWHCEAGGNFTEVNRILVWTIYLNDLPEGEGETEFLHYGKRIQPSKGDVLIFPAYFMHTHRGNPPLTTTKYIATGWWSHAGVHHD